MAMCALSKAGVPLVERFDTSVAEMELKYANNKLIGDDKPRRPRRLPQDHRGLDSGFRLLSRRRHHRAELQHPLGGRQWRRRRHRHQRRSKARPAPIIYVMNVGLDLRLVDTNTLEVVDVISYQKQIIGRQVQAGVFDFLGTDFFDASVGESALEPIQLAVRSVIERAVLEMTRASITRRASLHASLGTARSAGRSGRTHRNAGRRCFAQPNPRARSRNISLKGTGPPHYPTQ